MAPSKLSSPRPKPLKKFADPSSDCGVRFVALRLVVVAALLDGVLGGALLRHTEPSSRDLSSAREGGNEISSCFHERTTPSTPIQDSSLPQSPLGRSRHAGASSSSRWLVRLGRAHPNMSIAPALELCFPVFPTWTLGCSPIGTTYGPTEIDLFWRTHGRVSGGLFNEARRC